MRVFPVAFLLFLVSGCFNSEQLPSGGTGVAEYLLTTPPNNEELELCGDGKINFDVGEQCDDGNRTTENCSGDEDRCIVCGSDCRLVVVSDTACGDGRVDGTEQCDPGPFLTKSCPYGFVSCQVCNRECEWESGVASRCGDGVRDLPYEACDDGNAATESCAYGDTFCLVCNASCQLGNGHTHLCGDGKLDPQESCDEGNRITEACTDYDVACEVCDANCQTVAGMISYCGDKIHNAPQEECDDGNRNNQDSCLTSCQLPTCGDGFMQSDRDEQCDDGAGNTDTCPYSLDQVFCRVCNGNCQMVPGIQIYCGDGIINGPEECDNGDNNAPHNACTDKCKDNQPPQITLGVIISTSPAGTAFILEHTLEASDEEDDTLTYTLTDAGNNTVSIGSNGVYTLTIPAGNSAESTSFTYNVTDTASNTAIGEMPVTVVAEADSLNAFVGSSGPDILAVGSSNRMLTGGDGKDRFAFDTIVTSKPVHIVTDFNQGEDVLVLLNMDSDLLDFIGDNHNAWNSYVQVDSGKDGDDDKLQDDTLVHFYASGEPLLPDLTIVLQDTMVTDSTPDLVSSGTLILSPAPSP